MASGAFLWSFLTAVGVGVLFESYPVLLRIMGRVGGAYLARGVYQRFQRASEAVFGTLFAGHKTNVLDSDETVVRLITWRHRLLSKATSIFKRLRWNVVVKPDTPAWLEIQTA